jgi:hypothetical protein
LSMNPMPPNILTSVTPLTPDSAERTARTSSGSDAADWERDRDEAVRIALSLPFGAIGEGRAVEVIGAALIERIGFNLLPEVPRPTRESPNEERFGPAKTLL